MVEEWPTYGYDAAHAGHGTGVTRPDGPVRERWRHGFDGLFAYNAPSIGEVRGRAVAYANVRMTQVFAATARAVGEEGQLVWALHGENVRGGMTPTVVDDRVVFDDFPGIWVVAARSGGRIYEKVDDVYPWASPAVTADRIHYGFRALDLETGDEVWRYDADEPVARIVGPDVEEQVIARGPVGERPAVADGTVYVAGTMRGGKLQIGDVEDRSRPDEWGHIHALDAASGRVEWAMEFDTPVRRTPTVVADGTVYVVDDNATLKAFGAADGTERWTVALGAKRVTGLRPAVADGRLFVRDGGGELLSLDDAGDELWRAGLGDELAGPPAVVDGVVFASDADGGVYALDVTGDRRWQYDLDERLGTGPVVANERVYVAGYDLYCLEPRA